MGPQTLVYLSQFCNAGNKFIGVFTPTEYRMYDRDSAMAALRSLASTGIEAERGTVLYVLHVSTVACTRLQRYTVCTLMCTPVYPLKPATSLYI